MYGNNCLCSWSTVSSPHFQYLGWANTPLKTFSLLDHISERNTATALAIPHVHKLQYYMYIFYTFFSLLFVFFPRHVQCCFVCFVTWAGITGTCILTLWGKHEWVANSRIQHVNILCVKYSNHKTLKAIQHNSNTNHPRQSFSKKKLAASGGTWTPNIRRCSVHAHNGRLRVNRLALLRGAHSCSP